VTDHHPATGRPTPAVSERTEKALRPAMDRLLAGKPERTHGRLIKDNLWKEAQVSRVTMNRATVLAEWDNRTAATGSRTPGEEARRDHELAELRARSRRVTAERDQLRRQLDAAATVIAMLHAELHAARGRHDARERVVPLGGARPR
jgi:hypothetical protein